MAYRCFPELTVDDRFVLAQEPIARGDGGAVGRPRSLVARQPPAVLAGEPGREGPTVRPEHEPVEQE